jgi:mandelate racemase
VLDLAAPVLRTPLRVEAGLVTPSAGPGSGLEWDEDAVRRYRL